ncbi:amidase [Salisediminibacterium beveridgei]|uniref:Glutamyl-tRNA(Gln) amidotransferase subunit A n=1 Tax=Salisediminibacterium beveridgei TaxID=632773 RepID=A0A1D7QYE6_9BACI|nr:amidase [Salisediminibacterium beveridgei]AOM84036.1 Glutamyl-tRNA(Gln) amidotransferase subunit A [Salisediminibacterium beveridgei]
MIKEHYGAFIDEELTVAPYKSGILHGKSFAVKDVIHVAGHKNSAGNPDWFKTHEAAEETAPAIQKLLSSGATLKGMTVTDEMMYSLHGENIHYGTPANPVSKKLIPGGSSSGSAVAVASGLRDFAIGTDTGGSVRIPAAYCGLFGFRPSHGLISLEGVIPLAETFDTVGWFTRKAALLEDIGEVLLPDPPKAAPPFKRAVVAADAFQLLTDSQKNALMSAIISCSSKVSTREEQPVTSDDLSNWVDVFRVIQGYEIWQNHGEWVSQHEPAFGPGIRERFRMASTITEEDVAEARRRQLMIQDAVSDLMQEDTLLILPTIAGEAPEIGLAPEEVDQIRQRTMQLTCIAGLNGLPQVTLPVKQGGGLAPLAISIIAPRGRDRDLLTFVTSLCD